MEYPIYHWRGERSEPMITQKTAARIWECYREIQAAEKLLDDMATVEKDYSFEPAEEKLKSAWCSFRRKVSQDAFGRKTDLLFYVSPKLAESVIAAHIANKKAELVEANEQARIEIDS